MNKRRVETIDVGYMSMEDAWIIVKRYFYLMLYEEKLNEKMNDRTPIKPRFFG